MKKFSVILIFVLGLSFLGINNCSADTYEIHNNVILLENEIGEPTVDSLNHLLDNPRGISPLSEISNYRSWFGEDSGSIVWSDVIEKIDLNNSLESNIIPNADSIVEGYDYQIFGHTQQNKDPMITDKWACLDCRKAFILDEDGVLTQVTDEKTE